MQQFFYFRFQIQDGATIPEDKLDQRRSTVLCTRVRISPNKNMQTNFKTDGFPNTYIPTQF